MGGGGGGGGGLYDPSYEDALRILGLGHRVFSPFEQRARLMDDPEAAELARRLTALRRVAGVGFGPFAPLPTLGPAGEPAGVGQTVEALIAALQEVPHDGQKLAALCRQIERAGGALPGALALVCDHPAVQSKLAS
jgi:hypothetical protein